MGSQGLTADRSVARARPRSLPAALAQVRGPYLLLLPYLAHFVVVVAYPFLWSLYLSFFEAGLNRTPTFIGLGNFVRLAGDGQFWHALANTAWFTLFTVLGETALSLVLALLMNEQLRARVVFRTAYFLPVVTSWVVVSIMWSILFSRQGLVNGFLQLIGISQQPFLADGTQAMWIVIAVSIWKSLGYYMVIFLAGLQGIAHELYEAAALDGADRWRQIWHVALPGLRPVIYFVVSISLINAFQLFTQPYIMTNGGPLDSTLSVVQLLYQKAFVNLEFGYGSAIGTVLLFILAAVSLGTRRVNRWIEG